MAEFCDEFMFEVNGKVFITLPAPDIPIQLSKIDRGPKNSSMNMQRAIDMYASQRFVMHPDMFEDIKNQLSQYAGVFVTIPNLSGGRFTLKFSVEEDLQLIYSQAVVSK